jgi:gamma-glutamyltranspeptidase/glutathione hydrolase
MNNNSIISFIFLLTIFINGCSQPKINTNGAVSSTSRIASQVGIDILKNGGNAFDAIVATGFALAVTSPANGNLGGGGFLIAQTADGELVSLDFREKAPKLSFENMFLDKESNYVRDLALYSHISSGVPGTVNGLIKIFNDYGSGKFSLNEILQPAINLADSGFAIEQNAAHGFDTNKNYFIKDEGSKKLFIKDTNNVITDLERQFSNGKLSLEKYESMLSKVDEWKIGDIFIQKDLANTLRRIAKNGNKGFYEGETAKYIIEEMKLNNGLMSYQDLKDYDSVYRDPIVGSYRGYTIVSMGPPSSGGVLLIQMLNMLENFDVQNMKRNSTKFVHLLTEIQRLAYADRALHLGDPDFWNNPIDMLISKDYALDRLNLISLTEATPSTSIAAGGTTQKESVETTHYSVMDKDGNTAGITTTINFSYGNKKIVDRAGFLLNNEMDDFSAKPNVPNAFGLIGGKANAIQPYKRPLSSMSPTLVVDKNGQSILTVGAAGGSRIITAVLQIIISILDHDLNIQEAIDTPRIHSQWLPDFIFYEKNALDQNKIDELKLLNHAFYNEKNLSGNFYLARTHGIQRKDGSFISGADKRGTQNGNEAITY